MTFLFVDSEIGFQIVVAQSGDLTCDPTVVCDGTLGWAADDERGAGLVDEDVVHLVDDGVVQHPLPFVIQAGGHVVAEVVEAELVVGAVGDVGLVGFLAGDGAQLRRSAVRPVTRVQEI